MIRAAYLAGGKLHLYQAGDSRRVDSAYAEDVARRAMKIQKKNAWKTQGSGAQFMGMGGPNPDDLLDDGIEHARLTALTHGRKNGEILYTVSTGMVNGLFAYEVEASRETRLFHSAEMRVDQPALLPEEEVVAVVVAGKGGVAHVAVMRPDGTDLKEVTDGDVIDGAPSWVPGTHKLVYHSAGIGRDGEGRWVELAPAAIYLVDLDDGAHVELAVEAACDLTMPRMTADGTLYYVRRPHVRGGPSLGRMLLDVILFPFRMIFAMFGFLSFFTLRYTGKPLLTSGNARQKQADMRQMLIGGNLARAARAAGKSEEPARVSPTWHLMRKKDGVTETIARSVLCYDVGADGSIVYSDGGTLHHRAPDGTETKLATAPWINAVLALASRA